MFWRRANISQLFESCRHRINFCLNKKDEMCKRVAYFNFPNDNLFIVCQFASWKTLKFSHFPAMIILFVRFYIRACINRLESARVCPLVMRTNAPPAEREHTNLCGIFTPEITDLWALPYPACSLADKEVVILRYICRSSEVLPLQISWCHCRVCYCFWNSTWFWHFNCLLPIQWKKTIFRLCDDGFETSLIEKDPYE